MWSPIARKRLLFFTLMGNGSIDEKSPRFGSMYMSTLSLRQLSSRQFSVPNQFISGRSIIGSNTSVFLGSYKTKFTIELYPDYMKSEIISPRVQTNFISKDTH
ncbi:ZYBA0S06-07536g1_1 [Zygosaccharomyces bailii CLIB 213]|uniref:ZYBA0S06-07536g1_1 n=1 Tax=Zygosaccharomyces bailii (strain CLIB 213 / ATCC 58445 / CBS 680 / BCRC 21525 / NBRC 1098 / NCYC 1416 / NRRL Y-2227) TaxID=1333698 RepID=A0A8J2X946_ZYGB2|nr:ZYBA0S06-07536g1_1 [Zygosaccharomyces bailii CLIB 213]